MVSSGGSEKYLAGMEVGAFCHGARTLSLNGPFSLFGEPRKVFFHLYGTWSFWAEY